MVRRAAMYLAEAEYLNKKHASVDSSRDLFGMVTPPKTNMEPEKDGFQKESPFPEVHFQVP